MAEASQSGVSAPGDPEQRNENASNDPNSNDGSSGSVDDEDLQRAQILAHAETVATPPATPSIPDEIEMDITSNDLSEHAPGLYVARGWIRPRNLTQQEIDRVMLRLEVDLTLALSKIRAKSHKKRWNEDRVMIDMRMAGTPARGSTKVTLRPCIWIFCGSKWCKKIVERDVKALNWLGSHKVHIVRKGGPLLSADEERDAEDLNHSNEEIWSDSESLDSCASSAPSVASHQTDVDNTINRQAAPNQRYELPCELRHLTGCNVVFPGNDEGGWMDHIESHLGGRFPSKLCCWFCNDHYFDARQMSGGDLRYNFTSRMQHIRHHLIDEGFTPEQMLKDEHIVQHLFDNGFIDRHTYDSILAPATVLPMPDSKGSQSREGHHSHHRSHHGHSSHLPRVAEEEASGESSSRRHHSYHHMSDRYMSLGRISQYMAEPLTSGNRLCNYPYRNHPVPESLGHPYDQLILGRFPSESMNTDVNLKGPGAFASFSMSDNSPHASRSDHYGPSHASAYDSFHEPEVNTAYDQYYGLPESHSEKYHKSGTKPWGPTKFHLHIQTCGLWSLIGLTCISTTSRDQTELSRSISKIGGAISITVSGYTSHYGVTVGHGLVHQHSDVAPQSVDDSSVDGLSNDSDSTSEDEENPASDSAKSNYSKNRSSTDSAIDLSDAGWLLIDYGISADFVGVGFLADSQTISEPAKHVEDKLSGDLALVPLHAVHRPGLANSYIQPSSLEVDEVTCISENDCESPLPVVILLSPTETVSGTLQPGRFHFSMRGMPIDARQVKLSRDLALGSSGSWIVHDQTLYGMVIAVFPGECMALMIPSKRIISDVRKLCPGATDISVAIKH